MTVDERLAELGIELPEPAPPVAAYLPAVAAGNLLFVSGHIARREGEVVRGKVGRDLDAAAGTALARQVAIDMLATTRAALGDLDRVTRVVRLHGHVNTVEEFTGHSAVVDGASDLLVDVLGERGRHSRVAVGAAQLPLGAALELEMIVEIGDL